MISIGAACFGIVVGFITYRTLVRADKTAVADLVAVIGAIGGGVVTTIFKAALDQFAWYSVGLLGGMAVFFVLYLIMNGPAELAKVMSGRTITLGGQSGGQPPAGAPEH